MTPVSRSMWSSGQEQVGEADEMPEVITYHKPATVGEALWRSRAHGERAAFLAGGTSLLTHPLTGLTSLIDLSGCGLSYVRRGADERGAPRLEIGAMTTLQTLVDDETIAAYAGGLLATAAHHTATRTVRNTATVGGSIVACGLTTDIVVALLALQAEVVTGSGRILTLEDVLHNRFPTQKPRLYTEIHVYDIFAGCASALERVARLPSDRAIVNVAAVMQVQDGVCVRAGVAAGGVAEKPRRLDIADAILTDRLLDEKRMAHLTETTMDLVHPSSDILGSAEYRRSMLGVLLRRAVARCAEERNLS